MDKKILIFIGVGIIVLVFGAGGYLLFMPKCPEFCDDVNPCTQDSCSKETNYKCSFAPIPNCCGNKICETGETYETCSVDCPNCGDDNKCTKDSYDYHEQKCLNAPILTTVCCGNTVCETGETYQNCSRDCPNCDDNNKCTKDSYDYHQQKCLNGIIVPCCGNGICDKEVETYSICSTDCPKCDDNNKLTADSFDYTTQKCKYVVTHYFIGDFESGTQNWDFGGEGGAWVTTQEGANTVLKGVNHNWAMLRAMKWDNFIFKTKFKRVKGSMHFNYRLWENKRYFIGVGDNVYMARQTGDNEFSNLTDYPLSLDGKWHTFEVRGYNNILNIFIDDQLLIKYKDTEKPILSGGIGLETLEDSEYWIDDIEVKVIKASDVIYP